MAAKKSEQTRERVQRAAFESLRQNGFDGTTMRGIADAAGIAPGGIYYYFRSKDDIVSALYVHVSERYRDQGQRVLDGERSFAARLRAVYLLGFDLVDDYHDFAGSFLGTAITPGGASNPFGGRAREAKTAAVSLFDDVVTGSDLRVSAELRAELPELLWGAFMAGMLFWAYDRSPGQRRTRELVDRVVPLIAELLAVSRLPFLKKQLREAIGVVQLITGADDA
ncbi:TetR family transcriptional regulator [Mycetocola reblochoni]|uniref:Transcriptional regulator, TetR family n=2 Tax=Mycetocola reblochoni TaxID=331618 RepID=A0A1R4K3C1_9MICO|nr:TetR family transcriptional regulator [Mycetocola reblochoni]SJN38817.1 Transcriptional regulator, TetR family [Mycetocola reblochoni REB411]